MENVEQLSSALAEARERDRTTVIVCPTEPGRSLLDSGGFWDIGVAQVSTDPATRKVAEAHLQAARAQRRY